MKPIIEVNNLSKRYKLGVFNAGSLREEAEAFLSRFSRKKKEGIRQKGKRNGSTLSSLHSPSAQSAEFWALRDVSFDVQPGEVIGVIGRNGAGKSTLLKILSRITEPTSGEARIRGRVASLLEVGTGFHPELSGRENIFLNGAILGMSKTEIRNKFDEIVAFAEIEKFIDTPVKRYSSGMYVRLAFAVAAHLEPEILIIDEVLAVGDASFQKKCLGKMKDVSGKDGRTVLFVSHNMTALQSLCTRAVFLNGGKVEAIGDPETLINQYLSMFGAVKTHKDYSATDQGDSVARMLEATLLDHQGNQAISLDFYEGGAIEYIYEIRKPGFLPLPNVHVLNQKGEYVMVLHEEKANVSGQPGVYRTRVKIPPHLLNVGRYNAGLCVATHEPEVIHHFDPEGLVFDVIEDMDKRDTDYRNNIPGSIRPKLEWQTQRIS
jgi:lipopolysaccharide transport system ATP-binding protein